MTELDELEKQISWIEDSLLSFIKSTGYSYNHYAVLYSLVYMEDGACTQKSISEDWIIPKQTVFNVCKELKEKGWICFSESSKDKREKILHLTDKGRPYALKLYNATDEMSKKVFSAFGKAKTAKLFSLMHELSSLFKAEIAND